MRLTAVQRVQREAEAVERPLNPKLRPKGLKLRDEDKKAILKRIRDLRAHAGR